MAARPFWQTSSFTCLFLSHFTSFGRGRRLLSRLLEKETKRDKTSENATLKRACFPEGRVARARPLRGRLAPGNVSSFLADYS